MLSLRDLAATDAERLFAWRREPEVDRWMYQAPPADYGVHEAWVAGLLSDADRIGWIIENDGRACGFLMLKGLADGQRRAQWGWYIGEAQARGRGAGRAAQALGLERAFGDLGLRRVWSEVLAGNEAALRAQAAAGFKREGYLRGHAHKDGGFHDVVVLGMLAEEWAARREGVLKGLRESGLI